MILHGGMAYSLRICWKQQNKRFGRGTLPLSFYCLICYNEFDKLEFVREVIKGCAILNTEKKTTT